MNRFIGAARLIGAALALGVFGTACGKQEAFGYGDDNRAGSGGEGGTSSSGGGAVASTGRGGAASTGGDSAASGASSQAGTGGGSPSCAPGFTLCGAECVDTTTDPSHCGSCSDVCSRGSRCVNGECSIACDDTGSCGQCLDCAGSVGICQTEVAACLTNAECKAIVTCNGGCADFECFNACKAQHPSGAPLWQAAAVCAQCHACPNDCQSPLCQ